MKKTFWTILLLVPFYWLGAQNSQVFHLEQAVAYAKENSNQIKMAQIAIKDADAQINEFLSSGLPQVNGNASYQRYLKVPVQTLPQPFVDFLSMGGDPVDREVSFVLKNNFTASVSLQTLVFDGTFFIGLRAARAARAYAQTQMEQAEYELRKQVEDVYIPVLLVEENLHLLDSNINNLNRLLYETQETYKAGFAEQLDVDRLELSLSNLRTERENLERQLETSIRTLKFTINYPLEQDLRIADNLEALLGQGGENLLSADVDLSRRPELAVIEQGLILSDLNIRRFKAGYLPSLNASASYQQQYQGDTFNDGFWAPTSVVGLTLNVPIFDGFRKKSQIQRAKLERENVLLQQNDLIRLIRLEVTNAKTEYQNAGERLQSQARNLTLARRIYDTTQIKYREGVGSSIEVTQAEQSLYTSQSNYLQAAFDRLQAKTKLRQALGL